jgi:hypothetical protein
VKAAGTILDQCDHGTAAEELARRDELRKQLEAAQSGKAGGKQ